MGGLMQLIKRFLTVTMLCMTGFLALPFSTLAQSAHLAEITFAVNDRSASSFQQAVVTAYEQLMVTLSGNPAIMTIPAMQNTLSHASRYLSSYSYKQEQEKLYLYMAFDQRALKRVLQKTGQPVWNAARPKTLVIFVLPQHNGGFQRLANGDDTPIAQSLQRIAAQHGLPITLPLLDIEDQLALSEHPADGLSPEEIHHLVARYHLQHIVLGLLTRTEDEVSLHVDWKFWSRGTMTEWTTKGADIETLLTKGFDHLLELFASHYSVVKKEKLQNAFLLNITGVRDLQGYLRVMHALRHLTPVSDVAVKNMAMDHLLFEVRVTGNEEALRNALLSSAQFKPEMLSDLNVEEQPLQYEWKAG